jgi:hypothetical protein
MIKKKPYKKKPIGIIKIYMDLNILKINIANKLIHSIIVPRLNIT